MMRNPSSDSDDAAEESNLTLRSDTDDEESVTRDMMRISDLTLIMTEEANLTLRSDSDDEESSRGRMQRQCLDHLLLLTGPDTPKILFHGRDFGWVSCRKS